VTDLLSQFDDWGPEKIVVVSDVRTGMRGVLVIDNTARGMGKGGTRMSPSVSVAEIARLARVMTWKWAGVDMFFGGAKAGILGDPEAANKEQVLRAFARKLTNEVPREYVLGLDMGLDEYDAAILADELGDRGAAVGCPDELGGVPYDQLGVTGYGVVESAHVAAQRLGMELNAATVAIQGFGAVGRAAARRFVEYGSTVVAVSTSAGALHDPQGLDVDELTQLTDEYGDEAVRHYRGRTVAPLGTELGVDCDVLVPAARQDVIDTRTARDVKASLVIEGANLPATREALQVLADRKILVIPDFVANAGGIVAAGVAMEARYSPFRPDPQQILSLVADRIRANTAEVLHQAATSGRLPHDAARAIAQSRVRAAMTARGQLKAKANS
jgi:glutamate dehydrogenase (NAD(P)+)